MSINKVDFNVINGAASSAQGSKADNSLPAQYPQFLVGSARYPTTTGQRVDPTSWLSSNTVSSKNILSGAAAKDGNTWVESIMPGTDGNGIVTTYTISPNGSYGSVSAVRSTDNPASTSQNIIGHISVGMSNNPTVAHGVWGNYTHMWITSNAHVDSFVLGEESSIANLGANASLLTPYDLISGAANGNKGQKANLRLTAGTGLVASNLISNPIQITSNNGVYASGIIFGSGSLDSSSGYAPALSIPTNTGLSFYAATSTQLMWRVFSNVGSVANPGALIFGDGVTNMYQSSFDLGTAGKYFSIQSTKVVGARVTGWVADTGTAKRSTNVTYSATADAAYTQATIQTLMNAVRDLSQTVKALKDDLISHGLIGT